MLFDAIRAGFLRLRIGIWQSWITELGTWVTTISELPNQSMDQ